MRSIYEEVLGPEEFGRLHPKIQERFGFNSEHRMASIGTGVMESVWHGAFYTYPFLICGAFRRIFFPEQGRNIPFTVENYAYKDSFGRETMTWIRTFKTRKARRFDAYMINSGERGRIVDYLGTHQHLAVDLLASVGEDGSMRFESGEQRFYEGLLGFRFPKLFAGRAEVCESYDDSIGKYCISVEVTNRFWGRLFGYSGTFDVESVPIEQGVVPEHILPRREERRE